MKSLIVIAALLLIPVAGFCVDQPHNIGYVTTDGPLGIYVRTLAQIDALTPATTGQLVMCSNCKFALCISSGANTGNVGAFIVTASTTPAASQGAVIHCQ